MDASAAHAYVFGPFRLDVGERVLTRDGQPVPLTLKAFEILLLLVRNRGHVVTKEQMLNTVWADSFVGDGVLSVNIFNLRKALGSGEGSEPYIATIARRGYRFAAPVQELVGRLPVQAPIEQVSELTSLAVLPFKTLSADRHDEYLGLGLADALITRLSKIQRVLVRPTSVVRKHTSLEHDAAEIGRRLRVDAVLEGSIRQARGRIRLLLQLVGSQTGTTLWAEQFDEEFTDIFSVEDRVTEHVTRTLLTQLTATEEQQLRQRVTDNGDAYRLYLQGRYFWNKRTEAGLRKGSSYFREAIALDPDFALAWAGLADSELLGASSSSPHEAMPRAKAAVVKALALDDGLAEAHASLGRIKTSFEWDWAGAEREFRRALALNRNYATARQWYANLLLAVGRTDEAIAEIRRACALDPFSPILNCAQGWVHYMSRDYDQAVQVYRRTLEMDPHFLMARREIAMVYGAQRRFDEALAAIRTAISEGGENHFSLCILGHVLASAGQVAEASGVIEQLRTRRQSAYVPPQVIAVVHAALGDIDLAFTELRLAYDDRSSTLMWVKVDPWVDGLREDSRFEVLLRDMGLRA